MRFPVKVKMWIQWVDVLPVGHLLQLNLLVTVQQLSDVVTDDPHEEGDEDDGQHHPHPNTGVQQELRTPHDYLRERQTERERDIIT